MWRLITWLVMVPAGVAVIIFALHNKDLVQINLWPFAMIIEMELYLVLTIMLGVGLVLGGFVSWAGAGRVRAQLRKHAYSGEVTRRELESEREKNKSLKVEVRVLKEQLATNQSRQPGDDAKSVAVHQLQGPQSAA